MKNMIKETSNFRFHDCSNYWICLYRELIVKFTSCMDLRSMVWNFFEFGIEQMGYHVINKFINRFILYSFRVFFWISNILNSKKMLFNYSAQVLSLSLSLFFLPF